MVLRGHRKRDEKTNEKRGAVRISEISENQTWFWWFRRKRPENQGSRGVERENSEVSERNPIETDEE